MALVSLATRTLRWTGGRREGGTLKLLRNGNLTSNYDDECPATREVLSLVGDKWSVLIVVNLGQEKQRFSQLKRSLNGISHRVLTVTLRNLERDGLLTRTVLATSPVRVEYDLTLLGRSLLQPVTALAVWANEHKAEMGQARADYERATTHGKPAQLP